MSSLSELENRITLVRKEFMRCMDTASTLDHVDHVQSQFLGKKGELRQLSGQMRCLDQDDKARFGLLLNELREFVLSQLASKRENIQILLEQERFGLERVDMTLPGESHSLGGEHILKRTLHEVVTFFVEMGFCMREGPNIENEQNNFTLLNFAEHHPARDMQDTFYLTDDMVLRTHTSNVQIREMLGSTPPLKIVAPGLCFRNEDISARSHVLFHQVEAFKVDRQVNLKELTSLLSLFYNQFFGFEVDIRFRHSYFPFVEPGIEVDISCINCSEKGCQLCKHSGWLEVAGAGIIHPQVLENCGIDSSQFCGYALGMGIERLVMLKYRINDIRLFSENDIRFLGQFY